MDKHAVALVLAEIGTLLELRGESRFKASAFLMAARSVEKLDRDLGALVRAGLPAEAITARTEGRSIGEAILAETAKVGADLLVKGAFTQSRLRQMIFGGATSHIMAQATLPVFMAH